MIQYYQANNAYQEIINYLEDKLVLVTWSINSSEGKKDFNVSYIYPVL